MNHPNRVRLSKLSLGLLLALAAAPAFAQSTSAAIGGQVVGADGQPVSGAEVTITHIDSGTVSRATTDAAGRYNARGLRVGGPYTITINKAGAGSDTEENVYLTLNQIGTVDGQLNNSVTTLGTVQAVASAGTTVFSATKIGSGTSVDQQTIKNLPSMNGNIQDFMRLDPRVAYSSRADGSMSAGGQNPRFNKVSIDGVSATDNFGLENNGMPLQRQPVSLEAIEAIDIDLSNYDVTISGAAGANVNAVTKSGGNEFHGSLYGTYRDGDWFGKHPVTRLPFAEFQDEKTYGFTVGGPIMKDKLFFFANYEKYVKGSPSVDPSNTPITNVNPGFTQAQLDEVLRIAQQKWGFDAGGLVGSGNTELEEYALKLDWNISDNHRASFRYSKLEQDTIRPEGSNATTLTLSSNWFTQAKKVESYVGQVFSDWTENFSTEFKLAYRENNAIRVPPTTLPAIQIYFGNNAATPTAGDFIRLGTERSSMGNTLLNETWNFFGSATWTLGDHDVKFGVEHSKNDYFNFFLQDYWGNYSFLGTQAFERGDYFDFDLQTNPTNPSAIPAAFDITNLGLFLQDTWYVNSNLTLTLGVRADRPKTGTDPIYNRCFAAAPGVSCTADDGSVAARGGFGRDNTNTYGGGFIIQPRFGFNYTFNTERQTQMRGGVGLFQGDAPQVWVGNAYQTTGLNFLSYGTPGNFNASTSIKCTWVAGQCTTGPNFNTDGLNQKVPGPGSPPARSVNVIDDDFKLPSIWKANLAIDHELPWYGVVASAEILVTNTKDGLMYRSLNTGPLGANGLPTGFTGPDGRTLYWNPAQAQFSTNRFNRNTYWGDVFLVSNTDQGKSQQLTFMLNKPWTQESDWSWSFGYTYTNVEEVAALTNPTAGSAFGSQYNFNLNEETANTARYEIKDRFSGSVNWKHAFFGDYQTQVGLFYEGRSGRPFSYIFSGDANGDARTANDLLYVPAGPGDVLFIATNANISGPVQNNATLEQAFWEWFATQEGLQAYRGTYAPENGFRADWVNTFDVRITQELPGFFDGHKSKIWVDIQNVGNLLNKDWGHILDYGFFGNNQVAALRGIDPATGKYVFSPRTGTTFGSTVAIPTTADGFTNGISQWSIQVGLKYEF